MLIGYIMEAKSVCRWGWMLIGYVMEIQSALVTMWFFFHEFFLPILTLLSYNKPNQCVMRINPTDSLSKLIFIIFLSIKSSGLLSQPTFSYAQTLLVSQN